MGVLPTNVNPKDEDRIRRYGARRPGPTPPDGPVEGDTYWNTSTKTLYIWDGDSWEIVSGAAADSGWITPSYQNGWVNYDNTYGPAAYRKIDNVVWMRGLVRSGTVNTVIFTLPSGYRPPITMLFTVNNDSNITTCRLDIQPDGQVLHRGGGITYVQISCSFLVD